MSQDARQLCLFAASCISIAALIAVFNFIVDPLQLFHRAFYSHPYFLADPRIQDAGLIRSQSYDTVFIGTSLGVRYRQADIDRIFGVQSINLSISGPSAAELHLVLDAALDHHPRQIIWQMDDWIFRSSDEEDLGDRAYFPADLYRMNIRGVTTYLLDTRTIKDSIAVLLCQNIVTYPLALDLIRNGYVRLYYDDVHNIGMFPSDVNPATVFNAKHALAAFDLYHDRKIVAGMTNGYTYDNMVQTFERQAAHMIQTNPDTKFIVYFPPYSILQFVALREFSPTTLATSYKFNSYVLKRLSSFDNVSLFDFRDVKSITHDLNNYSDTIHHSLAIDIEVMEELRKGLHRVDRSNPTASILSLQEQVAAYPVPNAGH